MIIPSFLKTGIAFVCADIPNLETGKITRQACGTAFFVNYPFETFEGYEVAAAHVVTARHVVNRCRQYGQLILRVNTLNGSFVDLVTNPDDDWLCHDKTDIAVGCFQMDPAMQIGSIAIDGLATKETKLYEGDEVFFLSMFSMHAGIDRIEPIARFGHISLLPTEKVAVDLDGTGSRNDLIDAILVEARSWGGHSGSPAFVHFSPDRFGVLKIPPQPSLLLGLVHGHFSMHQPVSLEKPKELASLAAKVDINAGIATIIPAHQIRDFLEDERMTAQRKTIFESFKVRQVNFGKDEPNKKLLLYLR